jgi:hypothetical protein
MQSVTLVARIKSTVRHVTEIVPQKMVARLTPQTMAYAASQSHRRSLFRLQPKSL